MGKNTAPPADAPVTIDQVKILIAEAREDLLLELTEALKGVLTEEQVVVLIEEKTSKLITGEEARQLIAEAVCSFPATTELQAMPLLTQDSPGTNLKPIFDPAWLAGLTNRTGKSELRVADVLDYSVTGRTVTIVTTDGVKHTVEI
jgi:hypothetical protein